MLFHPLVVVIIMITSMFKSHGFLILRYIEKWAAVEFVEFLVNKLIKIPKTQSPLMYTEGRMEFRIRNFPFSHRYRILKFSLPVARNLSTKSEELYFTKKIVIFYSYLSKKTYSLNGSNRFTPHNHFLFYFFEVWKGRNNHFLKYIIYI